MLKTDRHPPRRRRQARTALRRQPIQTYIVRFDVGSRGPWEARIERPITEAKLARAVRNRRVLLSHDVSATFAAETPDSRGSIFAGACRVGSFEILPNSGGVR